ncbi:hypothetical protein P7C71_g1946, partial [Lecanoromycetidae sp. Uapishka_2]
MKLVDQILGLLASGLVTSTFAQWHHGAAPAHVVAPANVVAPASSVTSAAVVATSAASVSTSETKDETSTSSSSSSSCDGVQVNFVASGGSYDWLFQGTGASSGNSASDNPSLCMASGNSYSFFFGSNSAGLGNAGYGNTLLETTIKASGGQNVFDVSLCDGYSMAMQCTGFTDYGSSNAVIGGTESLWSLGTCPDVNGPNCVNTGSHSDSAAAFFTHGGAYWYDDDTPNPGQSTFTGRGPITCTIYTNTLKSKAKREESGTEAVRVEAREAMDSEVGGLRTHAAHKGRVHARALRKMSESQKI